MRLPSRDERLSERAQGWLKAQRSPGFCSHLIQEQGGHAAATVGWIHEQIFNLARRIVTAVTNGGVGITQREDAGCSRVAPMRGQAVRVSH